MALARNQTPFPDPSPGFAASSRPVRVLSDAANPPPSREDEPLHALPVTVHRLHPTKMPSARWSADQPEIARIVETPPPSVRPRSYNTIVRNIFPNQESIENGTTAPVASEREDRWLRYQPFSFGRILSESRDDSVQFLLSQFHVGKIGGRVTFY